MQFLDVDLPPFQSLLAELVAQPSISSPLTDWDQSNLSVISVLETWFRKLGFRD